MTRRYKVARAGTCASLSVLAGPLFPGRRLSAGLEGKPSSACHRRPLQQLPVWMAATQDRAAYQHGFRQFLPECAIVSAWGLCQRHPSRARFPRRRGRFKEGGMREAISQDGL